MSFTFYLEWLKLINFSTILIFLKPTCTWKCCAVPPVLHLSLLQSQIYPQLSVGKKDGHFHKILCGFVVMLRFRLVTQAAWWVCAVLGVTQNARGERFDLAAMGEFFCSTSQTCRVIRGSCVHTVWECSFARDREGI